MSNGSVDNQFSEMDLLQMVQTYHNNTAELLRLGNRVMESSRPLSSTVPLSSRSPLSSSSPLLRSYVLPLIQPRSSSSRSASTQTDDFLRDTSSQWLQQLLGNYTDVSYSFYVQIPETTASTRRITTGQLVDNIRTFVYQDDMAGDLMDIVCPISQADFKEGDILCELNRCKHVFKQEEIYRWLNQHTNCPVCRTELVSLENEPTQTTPTFTPTTNRYTRRGNETDRLGNNLDNILNEALQSLFRPGTE